MAAGEYVSMASQREMYEREISLEAQELDEKPKEKREELHPVCQAKGLEPAGTGRASQTASWPIGKWRSTRSLTRDWALTRPSSARRCRPPSRAS